MCHAINTLIGRTHSILSLFLITQFHLSHILSDSCPFKGISSRAPKKAPQASFRPPAPKNRPSRAPKSPVFASSDRNWRRRTQPESGALGVARGRRANRFWREEPRARRVSDSTLFSPLRRPHRLVSRGESMPKLPRRSACAIDASRAAQ